MKNLFKLFLVLCLCALFTSCTDDDKITLTVNTSAYDVFKDLKTVDGTNYFTGQLPDGLEVRFSYLVVRQGESLSQNDEIVELGEAYAADIQSVASYTTGELMPGVYNVYVTTDLVKGQTEFNAITADRQQLALNVNSLQSSGVYNAFGTAFRKDILVEKKTEMDLDTQRKGTLLTLLFKNTPQTTAYTMRTEKFEFYTWNNNFSSNTKAVQHTISSSITSAQHYCGSASDFYLSWDGGYKDLILVDGRDRVLELNYANLQVTEK